MRACLRSRWSNRCATSTDQVKDKGPGGHILTGPIYIEDAQPGDVLEVTILAIKLAIPYAYNAFGPGPAAICRTIILTRK